MAVCLTDIILIDGKRTVALHTVIYSMHIDVILLPVILRAVLSPCATVNVAPTLLKAACSA